jgi:preprotein translocase subunit YajC
VTRVGRELPAITTIAWIAMTAAAPAFAQGTGAPPPGAATFATFFPFIALFAIMYFLIIRPQQKKADDMKKMQAALKKGDRVITQAGILGTIARVGDDTIVLKVGGDNELEFLRGAVVGLQPERK